jgi:SAM-dependent methyltransferase
LERGDHLRANLANLHLYCRDTIDWFAEQADQSFDYVGLSNILELLPPSYAAALQKEVERCTRPGGIICLRAIFPRQGSTFTANQRISLDQELSREAEKLDRSLFCNFYEIYKRA